MAAMLALTSSVSHSVFLWKSLVTLNRLPIPGLFPRSPFVWVMGAFTIIGLLLAYRSWSDMITVTMLIVGILAGWATLFFGGIWEGQSHLFVWQGLWYNRVLKRDIKTVDYRYKIYRPQKQSLCIIMSNGRSVSIPGALYRNRDQDYDVSTTIMSVAHSVGPGSRD